MKYLLDTDLVIDYLHNVQSVVQRVDEVAPSGLMVSILSVAELYEGVYYSNDRVGNEIALRTFLTNDSIAMSLPQRTPLTLVFPLQASGPWKRT